MADQKTERLAVKVSERSKQIQNVVKNVPEVTNALGEKKLLQLIGDYATEHPKAAELEADFIRWIFERKTHYQKYTSNFWKWACPPLYDGAFNVAASYQPVENVMRQNPLKPDQKITSNFDLGAYYLSKLQPALISPYQYQNTFESSRAACIWSWILGGGIGLGVGSLLWGKDHLKSLGDFDTWFSASKFKDWRTYVALVIILFLCFAVSVAQGVFSYRVRANAAKEFEQKFAAESKEPFAITAN